MNTLSCNVIEDWSKDGISMITSGYNFNQHSLRHTTNTILRCYKKEWPYWTGSVLPLEFIAY
jgi:hypothetical protein